MVDAHQLAINPSGWLCQLKIKFSLGKTPPIVENMRQCSIKKFKTVFFVLLWSLHLPLLIILYLHQVHLGTDWNF
jgi:hypothetical protein